MHPIDAIGDQKTVGRHAFAGNRQGMKGKRLHINQFQSIVEYCDFFGSC